MNSRVFKLEELQKLDFAQLLLLKEGLKESHPNNKQAWIELDEWLEGYVHNNSARLNAEFRARIKKLMDQAVPEQKEEKPPVVTSVPVVSPVEASVSKQGVLAPAPKGEPVRRKPRLSVLEQFFEDQENSWCPIM